MHSQPGAGVFVIHKDGSLSELHASGFEREEDFQKLLEKYPSLIPGSQVDPVSPRRWILVTRELGIAMEQDGSDRVWLDHLFLDQDGIPTLIEVKRKGNTQARREVVAQMLDYAANAMAYLPVQKIREKVEAANPDFESVLRQSLGWNQTANEYWATVKTNMEAGRLRLVFVADKVPPELQRIVEFLNLQTDPLEILAVEIPKFEGEGIQALVPRVLGQTLAAKERKGTTGGPKIAWEWDTFSQKLAAQGESSVQVARSILEWAKNNQVKIDWMENIEGSFIPSFDSPAGSFYPIRVTAFGQIGWNAPHSGNNSPEPFDKPEMRRQLLKRFQLLPGASVSPDNLEGYKAIQLPLNALDQPEALQQFLDVLSWVKEKMAEGPP